MTSLPKPRSGFNLIGHLTSRIGLGSAVRMTASLIDLNGWGMALTDLEVGIPGDVPVPVKGAPIARLGQGPFSINLLHLNPQQIMHDILAWEPQIAKLLGKRFCTCVPFWELDTFPSSWLEVLSGMDAILAPSRFVQKGIEKALESTVEPPRIEYFMQAIPVIDISQERTRWFRNRSKTVVFLASFDFSSDSGRKNPHAVLSAFRRAFEGSDTATLVFKTAHALEPGAIAARDELLRSIKGDMRIQMIDANLTDQEMRSLQASADAYISLHRSEGLGLGLMESMALGVPAIATGWSGNMDFMTKDNSLLVRFEMAPVKAGYHPAYRTAEGSASWADPDVDDAARCMRLLASDASLRRALGLRGQQSMADRWIEYRRAIALQHILEQSGRDNALGSAHRLRIHRLYRDALKRRITWHRLAGDAKRVVVSGLRAAHLKTPAPSDEHPVGVLRELDPYRLGIGRL